MVLPIAQEPIAVFENILFLLLERRVVLRVDLLVGAEEAAEDLQIISAHDFASYTASLTPSSARHGRRGRWRWRRSWHLDAQCFHSLSSFYPQCELNVQ
jgi:hypothetical protein